MPAITRNKVRARLSAFTQQWHRTLKAAQLRRAIERSLMRPATPMKGLPKPRLWMQGVSQLVVDLGKFAAVTVTGITVVHYAAAIGSPLVWIPKALGVCIAASGLLLAVLRAAMWLVAECPKLPRWLTCVLGGLLGLAVQYAIIATAAAAFAGKLK